jgi:predicted dehydrogenase/aryl-alcohol dehydrogenase-like predicted oxidoreductase
MDQSTSKLQWGIIGTGGIAKTFTKGVRDSRSGTVIAVGSRTQESADKFGDEFDVPQRHATYEELLQNPEVQAVYISTPHPMHAEWAIKAAEAGKHVLCEKPLTLNYPTSMAVVEAAIRNNVILMEAFMYRCHPQTAKIAELIRDGELGEVRIIQATFSFHASDDPNSRVNALELGGGGILDVGCYTASMARLIAGAAIGQPFANPLELKGVGHLGATGSDDWAIASAKFPNDIVAQLATGVKVNQESVVRVHGSKGSLLVPSPWFCAATDGKVKLVLTRHGKGVEEIIIDTDRSLYAYEADVFADCVAAGKVLYPGMSPEDALGNMQTLDLWRKEIGLQYPDEKEPAVASGRALKVEQKPPMQYANVPGIDKPISRLVLGTMLEGAINRVPHASALFDYWIEQGGNCFDTAHIYGTERIVGNWLRSRGIRDDVVIIAKGAHTPNCDPENLTRQLHESLNNLQVESVDLYMMHRDNLEIPVGEFVDVLNEHLQAGRIKAFGGSNWSLQRIEEANEYARQKGLTGFVAASNNFSLARMVNEVWAGSISTSDQSSRNWFERTQMALFSWSSQARGFFVRGDRDFTADAELVRCWYSDDNFQRLERVKQLAEKRGVLPINIAAAYVLNQPFPTFALIGPRALSEIRTSLPALEIKLTEQERRFLNLED